MAARMDGLSLKEQKEIFEKLKELGINGEILKRIIKEVHKDFPYAKAVIKVCSKDPKDLELAMRRLASYSDEQAPKVHSVEETPGNQKFARISL